MLLCLAVLSCAPLPARRPLVSPPPRPSSTPAPAPLFDLRGAGSYRSPTFLPPPGGWRLFWSYRCGPRSGNRWRLSLTAAETYHQHSARTVVLRAGSGSSPPSPRRAHGMTVMTLRGEVYLAVAATAGCASHLRALPGP